MLTKTTTLLWWIAGISGVAVVLLSIVMVTGELGEPTGAEWVYLFFFPFGFSVGYVTALRWPLAGGCVSLACRAISQAVTGTGVRSRRLRGVGHDECARCLVPHRWHEAASTGSP